MKKVLVVDDSKLMRYTMIKILKKHGYTVVGEANNGRIGLEKYKELSPDLVTMDITMDEMCGMQALKEIMTYDSGANVIMVTSMGQDIYIKEAAETGAKGFLIKPYDEKMVISVLSKFC